MQLTPREYLEIALKPIDGTGLAVDAKNKVSIGLQEVQFEILAQDCVRPSVGDKTLQAPG